MTTMKERLAARAAAAAERQGSMNEVEKGGEGKKFKTAPEGKHKARLAGYIEIGKHENRFDPSKDPADKFILRFALFGKDCQEEDGSPITIDSREITISRFERANAVKLFRQMCPKRDADHFMELIDRVFWVEVTHNKQTKGDKEVVYANIKQESIVPGVREILDDDDNIIGYKDIACDPLPEKMFQIFEWANPTIEDFKPLKPWDKDKIRKAVNFPGSHVEQVVGKGDDKPANTNDGAATNAPEGDDEPQQTVDTPKDIPVEGADLPML
ncbi:hypothetical protein AXI70_gp21 [Cronobacter phage Dev-CD-23823]|uniref:Uncharacterized protein n=1 Tax=Cronobacter phage Dev-CD-23823 TaxID=1712539 RepID=A0A0K8IXM9_9CAUD|nr:hypothetical protein AXI70_gp21 [Cronobacter phage Dev-CD-23823]CUH74596.1 hypothetical protein [Cronobacter phage Dev-CD-23823]